MRPVSPPARLARRCSRPGIPTHEQVIGIHAHRRVPVQQPNRPAPRWSRRPPPAAPHASERSRRRGPLAPVPRRPAPHSVAEAPHAVPRVNRVARACARRTTEPPLPERSPARDGSTPPPLRLRSPELPRRPRTRRREWWKAMDSHPRRAVSTRPSRAPVQRRPRFLAASPVSLPELAALHPRPDQTPRRQQRPVRGPRKPP